jgi:hypothetical protein
VTVLIVGGVNVEAIREPVALQGATLHTGRIRESEA